MASLQELKQERLDKLKQLQDMGYQSHQVATKQEMTNADFLLQFENLEILKI